MGKKINVKNIVQLSNKIEDNLWNMKYYEKKKSESPLYTFLVFEIKKFIKIFLQNHELILHDYKINFSESELQIFVSYFKSFNLQSIINKSLLSKQIHIAQNAQKPLTKKSILLNYRINKQVNFIYKINQIILYYNKIIKIKQLIKKKINQKIIKFSTLYKDQKTKLKFKNLKLLSYLFKIKKNNVEINNFLLSTKKKLNSNIKFFYKKYLFKKMFYYYLNNIKFILKINLKFKNKLLVNPSKIFETKDRLKNIKSYNYYLKLNKNKISKTIQINNFLEKFVESLNVFIKSKININIVLQQINKDIRSSLTIQQLQVIKKISIQLRRFQNEIFFKEGLNLSLLISIKQNTSELLSQYIALQLKAKKNHNNFFKFLNQLLSLFFSNQILKVKGIKILIKGRFNKSPRSKKKLIFIGKQMPLMSLNSNIQYSESISYGPNGTFGIKVWINE